jgi:hypothetical protein
VAFWLRGCSNFFGSAVEGESCPHSHWQTARLERHSSSEPRKNNFSRYLSQMRTICSAERCVRASSSLCGVAFVSVALPELRDDANLYIRELDTRSTGLYLRMLVLDAKLLNRFNVMRRKIELRFSSNEYYGLAR